MVEESEVEVSGRTPVAWRRRPTFKDLGRRLPPACDPSKRVFLFFAGEEEEEDDEQKKKHFLDRCSLCKKRIARDKDVFMYMGNVPFCSEECRGERIEMDEAKERSRRFAMKAASSGKERQKSSSSSSSVKSHINHTRHVSTAVAA